MTLIHRQQKIQAKRMKTPWREFVREIASWAPFVFHKQKGLVTRYAPSQRVQHIMRVTDYMQQYPTGMDVRAEGYVSGRSFWEQLGQLLQETPVSSVIHFASNENAAYADSIVNVRNVYCSFVAGENVENVFYSAYVFNNSRNIFNSFLLYKDCHNVFCSRCLDTSSNVYWSKYIYHCHNIWSSSNLRGCTDCIKCHGLENASYCIDNKQYSKDDYLTRKAHYLTEVLPHIHDDPVPDAKPHNYGSSNVSGSCLIKSHNIENGYYVSHTVDARNAFMITNDCSNFYDVYDCGLTSDWYVACNAVGIGASHIYCSSQVTQSQNIFYSYHLESCSFCLGCIGLRNKSYCILNKQYSKEEWYEKVDEIFGEMESEGILGDFFPASLCPFYFNDTAAYLIDDSFTEQEIVEQGYLWRQGRIKVDIPEGVEVVSTSKLDNYEGMTDGSRHIDPNILNVVIQDEQGDYYRIMPMEYKFLKQHGLPLPRQHWLTRLKSHFSFAQ